MALPSFFDRTLQSAAQVLRGSEPEALAKIFGGQVATLGFDRSAISTAEGRATLDLTARLLARMYPRITFMPLGDAVESDVDWLRTLAADINPAIELSGSEHEGNVAIVIGETRITGTRNVIYAGSDRWIARLSSEAPVGSSDSNNPFGAGAAACLGAANLFRVIFKDRLTQADLDGSVTLSLLDFGTGAEAANGDLPYSLNLKRVQLAGAGAIGHGFLWALANTDGLRGDLDVIDHEAIDLSNLQRYVLALSSDVDVGKTIIAERVLTSSKLAVHSHQQRWAEFARSDPKLDHVAVALDTAHDRVLLQGSLPRRISNAWTQPGDLGLSRHTFGGKKACLACLYLPTGPKRNLDEIITEELGLSSAHLMQVREMLELGTVVDEAFLNEVATARNIDPDELVPFKGLPLRTFRTKAICGSVLFAAKDGGGADTDVPLAFQSALAGIMLAAEVVAVQGNLRSNEVATKTVIDVLRPLTKYLSFNVAPNKRGAARCICRDNDWTSAYERKHST